MKKLISLRAIVFLILPLVIGSCKEESGCTEFGSDNYDPDAIVDDGSCIPAREKFLGQFDASSNCLQDNYFITITAATKEEDVILSALSDTLLNVQAQVFLTEITIENQFVGNGVTIEGAGVYSGTDTISLSYRIVDVRTGIEQITDCFEELVRM